MTWTLAIDTSAHVAVGLAHDGVAAHRLVVTEPRAHAERLMPTVLEVCSAAEITLTDVNEVVVGMGPGPFTGLRVGITTAFTLAALAGTEPARVCSLDAYALQWPGSPPEFVVATDARRRELYWAHYVDGNRVGDPQVGAPGALPELPVCGPVPPAARETLDWVADGPRQLDAAVLAAHWRRLPTAGSEPYYLRPADAAVGGPAKSVLPRVRLR